MASASARATTTTRAPNHPAPAGARPSGGAAVGPESRMRRRTAFMMRGHYSVAKLIRIGSRRGPRIPRVRPPRSAGSGGEPASGRPDALGEFGALGGVVAATIGYPRQAPLAAVLLGGEAAAGKVALEGAVALAVLEADEVVRVIVLRIGTGGTGFSAACTGSLPSFESASCTALDQTGEVAHRNAVVRHVGGHDVGDQRDGREWFGSIVRSMFFPQGSCGYRAPRSNYNHL